MAIAHTLVDYSIASARVGSTLHTVDAAETTAQQTKPAYSRGQLTATMP